MPVGELRRAGRTAHAFAAVGAAARANAAPRCAADARRRGVAADGHRQDLRATQRRFETWDCNCNGYLSLAEIDRGCSPAKSAQPVVLRVRAARGAVAVDARGEDYVEMGKEFRLLLLFLRQYAGLFSASPGVDTDGDRQIDLDGSRRQRRS